MCFFLFDALCLSSYRQPEFTPIGRAAVKFRLSPMGGGDLGRQPQAGALGGPAVPLQRPGEIPPGCSRHRSALYPQDEFPALTPGSQTDGTAAPRCG